MPSNSYSAPRKGAGARCGNSCQLKNSCIRCVGSLSHDVIDVDVEGLLSDRAVQVSVRRSRGGVHSVVRRLTLLREVDRLVLVDIQMLHLLGLVDEGRVGDVRRARVVDRLGPVVWCNVHVQDVVVCYHVRARLDRDVWCDDLAPGRRRRVSSSCSSCRTVDAV